MSLDDNKKNTYLSGDHIPLDSELEIDTEDVPVNLSIVKGSDGSDDEDEQDVDVVEAIPDQELGSMKYHGILSGSTSFHGKSPELLRKCLDLSILRSDLATSRWCVLELDRFKLVKGEPLRTNLINRLIYSIPKYLGNSNPDIIPKVDQLVTQWEKVRKHNGIADRQVLLHILQILVSTPINTRLVEYQTVYYDMLNYQDITSHESYQKLCPNYDHFADEAHGCWELAKPADPDELVCLMDGLVYNFMEENTSVYYWLFQIVEMGNLKTRANQRYRRYRPEYAVWEYLFSLTLTESQNQVLQVLFNWYRAKLDPSLYLTQAIDFLLSTASDTSATDDNDLVKVNLEEQLPSLDEITVQETNATSNDFNIREYMVAYKDYRPTDVSPYQEVLDMLLAKQASKKTSGRKSGRKKKNQVAYMDTEELVADIPPIEE